MASRIGFVFLASVFFALSSIVSFAADDYVPSSEEIQHVLRVTNTPDTPDGRAAAVRFLLEADQHDQEMEKLREKKGFAISDKNALSILTNRDYIQSLRDRAADYGIQVSNARIQRLLKETRSTVILSEDQLLHIQFELEIARAAMKNILAIREQGKPEIWDSSALQTQIARLSIKESFLKEKVRHEAVGDVKYYYGLYDPRIDSFVRFSHRYVLDPGLVTIELSVLPGLSPGGNRQFSITPIGAFDLAKARAEAAGGSLPPRGVFMTSPPSPHSFPAIVVQPTLLPIPPQYNFVLPPAPSRISR